MSELRSGKKLISNVFQLLGHKENALSKTLAWVFSNNPDLLMRFLSHVIHEVASTDDVLIRIQEYENSKGVVGITDIEISNGSDYYVIIEAKRGWVLPDLTQLEKYVKRESFTKSKALHKVLVVVSDCTTDYCNLHLDRQIAGTPILNVSWDELTIMARNCIATGNNVEKRMLKDLIQYLGGRSMRNIDSSRVYVVSLGYKIPNGWKIGFRDIVEKKLVYFHPVGNRWPKEPPNYIAFRYDGKLHSIHHIDGYEIVTNMNAKIQEIPSEDWEPHFLYTLGPAFSPSNEVKNGDRVRQSNRVWVFLDTLFTASSISDALSITEQRIGNLNI